MRLRIIVLFCLGGCGFGFQFARAADKAAAISSLSEAEQDPDFLLQGEYVATDAATARKALQVVGLGAGKFRLVIYTGGLPGAGWDGKTPQVLDEEDASVARDLIESLQVAKTSRRSPTLGAPPPADATVLFNGEPELLGREWLPGAKMTDDGLLHAGALSQRKFGDCTLHLEFQTPWQPAGRGQGRGNSGVYVQGRYEAQVLDSFGLEGKNNEAGGIYQVSDPALNMCFPPLSWQTYDIDFTAARWEGEMKVASARMTVRLNGVVVQNDVELPGRTPGGPIPESSEDGPLYLQDHGDPVRFRNIWIAPRDAARAARRPLIPAYERYLSQDDASPLAGQLLAGELNCLQCHAANDSTRAAVIDRPAPVLSNVGTRIRQDWIRDYLTDPQSVHPGTTMPDLLADLPPAERETAIESLTAFLGATGKLAERGPDRQLVKRGQSAFRSLGCLACHNTRPRNELPGATSIPLTQLDRKYSIPSLAAFLKEPLAAHPAGRMPSFNLSDKAADELAHFLISGDAEQLPPNVTYQVYHGAWENLPRFDDLEPVKSGECSGFDLSVAGRDDHFGIRFQGYLLVHQADDFVFTLSSDDGSRLSIDGQAVLSSDHSKRPQQATVSLSPGVHRVQVDYHEFWGDERLRVELSIPPWIPPQDLSALLTTHSDGTPIALSLPEVRPAAPNEATGLIGHGRELFSALGCANCHEMSIDGQRVSLATAHPNLTSLNALSGCLADEPVAIAGRTVPRYDLTVGQRRALRRWLASPALNAAPTPEQVIAHTLATFNCYACHSRGGVGGPEAARDKYFTTSQPEMGDEGRLPPALDGVGDKLHESWLKQVLSTGGNDRPYMRTRMPRFGDLVAQKLTPAFLALDRQPEREVAEFDEPPLRVKSTGRKLVGNGGLGCIKCHTFGSAPASGIQAISLTTMTRRLREDWFRRYLVDPAKFRPGTRMPTGFPNGQAVIRDVYEGDVDAQLSAIWSYLSDGDSAGPPDGLVAKMIELQPADRPIIYRNFLTGLSPRGIAVGYPGGVNLAWDANDLRLKLIWHNRFLDASMHWSGRGNGTQQPLGDHVIALTGAFPWAELPDATAPWPAVEPRKDETLQFLGYRLNAAGEPTFRYRTSWGEVAEHYAPLPQSGREPGLRRTWTIHPERPAPQLVLLAARGNQIEAQNGGFLIDGAWRTEFSGDRSPTVRAADGSMELLLPTPVESGATVRIVQDILW